MTRLCSAAPSSKAMPTIVDAHVGNRIRLRRTTLGLPMTVVAKNLGISWQQLGKYEQAKNRISASILYLVASALDVPVDFFFAELQSDETSEGVDDGLQTAAIPDLLTHDARGQHIGRLIASYWRIADARQRGHVLGLMQALAGQAKAPSLIAKLRPDPV